MGVGDCIEGDEEVKARGTAADIYVEKYPRGPKSKYGVNMVFIRQDLPRLAKTVTGAEETEV